MIPVVVQNRGHLVGPLAVLTRQLFERQPRVEGSDLGVVVAKAVLRHHRGVAGEEPQGRYARRVALDPLGGVEHTQGEENRHHRPQPTEPAHAPGAPSGGDVTGSQTLPDGDLRQGRRQDIEPDIAKLPVALRGDPLQDLVDRPHQGAYQDRGGVDGTVAHRVAQGPKRQHPEHPILEKVERLFRGFEPGGGVEIDRQHPHQPKNLGASKPLRRSPQVD